MSSSKEIQIVLVLEGLETIFRYKDKVGISLNVAKRGADPTALSPLLVVAQKEMRTRGCAAIDVRVSYGLLYVEDEEDLDLMTVHECVSWGHRM